jgi:hypothetical protein
VTPRFAWPSWRWITSERDPFACHLDRVGVSELVGSEAPSDAGLLCESVEVAAYGGAIPAAAGIRAVDDAEQRTGGQLLPLFHPGPQLFPGPRVHADLASAAAFAEANRDRASAEAQIGLVEHDRLVDP